MGKYVIFKNGIRTDIEFKNKIQANNYIYTNVNRKDVYDYIRVEELDGVNVMVKGALALIAVITLASLAAFAIEHFNLF